jgi:RHS repeat-associated protein
VNVWDGSERHTVMDVRMPGYIPIEFTRIYDSSVDYDSAVGYGWAHGYDMRVFRYPDGSVMLRRTCGGRRLFVFSGSGYVSPPGEFRNTLLENGDGTLTLLEASGTEYRFDLKGRLERIQDVHGNRLELEYDPAGRLPTRGASRFSRDPNAVGVVALDYRLTRVRERDALGVPTGREITLSYDSGTGRLREVQDHTGRAWDYAHDARGNLISVTDPLSNAHTYGYADPNDFHNLTSVNEGPTAFTLVYDAMDRVTRQTMSSGTVLDIVYNVPLTRTTVTTTVKDPNGTAIRTGVNVYEFNSFGNPTKLTDALGNEFTYTRDAEGSTTVKEVRQNVPGTGLVLVKTVGLTYDAAGNVLEETHTNVATGEVVTKTFTYDHASVATMRTTSSLDPNVVHGSDYVYAHNARGYPTTLTQERRIVSGGGTPTPTFFDIDYAYDATGQITQVTYPNGDTDTYAYTNGLATGMNGDTFTRDARGNILTRTDRNGNTWTYTYDALNRILTAEDPTGASTLATYTGLLMTQLEVGKTAGAPGRVHLMTYDAAGRLARLQRQRGPGPVTIQTFTRDSEGNALTVTDAAGRTVRTTYDLLGRPATIRFGTGGTITQEYDAFGNLIRSTDGAGRVTRYTYWTVDQPGRPLTATNGLNKTYTAVLYANGTLKTLTDPLGRALTEVHDALGRLVSFSAPSGPPTTFTYNGRSAVATRTDASGNVTTYGYNARGAMTGIDHPGPDAVVLTRDPGDRLTRAVDIDSDLSFAYDDADRITQETNNLTGRSVTTTYNTIGQRTSVVTSDGVTIAYEYNDLDQLAAVRRNGTLEAAYTRDLSGLVTRTDFGNGTFTTFTRDGAGRVQTQETRDASSTLLSRINYTRDGAGIVTVKHEEVRRPDGTYSDLFFHYTHDAGLRLTREEIRASDDATIMSARTFTYDDVGNRLTMAFDGGSTTTYVYSGDYRLTSETTGGSSITYTYDLNGNLLTETFSGQTVQYGYDFENRVVSLDSPTDAADYVLSWDGRRLSKLLNGSATEYLYDGMNAIAEYPAGSPAISYLAASGLDELVARVEGGQKSYYHQVEDLRTVVQMTGPSGAVENSYVHQAFGELLESHVNTQNVYTFTGRSRDAETQHLYFRERLYSPRTGRFLSLDPYRPDAARSERIGGPGRLALSLNGVQDSPLFGQRRDVNVTGMDVTGYVYVGNSPINATDPTGEAIIWNPVSGSIFSGCTFSGCGLSGCGGSVCLGSACGASACAVSVCTVSGCGVSGCGASGCAASMCAGTACGGSMCGTSGCLISACTLSGCVGTACYGSVCGGSACIGSACVGSICAGSACLGSSYCVGSACTASNCVGSVCVTSDCSGSRCSAQTACGGSSCTGSVCTGSSCSSSGCTSSGCGSSAGCSTSGCGGSICNAGSGCNSPCCK